MARLREGTFILVCHSRVRALVVRVFPFVYSSQYWQYVGSRPALTKIEATLSAQELRQLRPLRMETLPVCGVFLHLDSSVAVFDRVVKRVVVSNRVFQATPPTVIDFIKRFVDIVVVHAEAGDGRVSFADLMYKLKHLVEPNRLKEGKLETFHVHGDFSVARGSDSTWAQHNQSLLVIDSEFPADLIAEMARAKSLLCITTKGAPQMLLTLSNGQFLVDSPLEALADCYHLLKVKPHEGRTTQKK